MINNHGHTRRDADELRAAGIDPQDTQPRERGTFCLCGRSTWHQMGRCDAHYLPPAAVRRNTDQTTPDNTRRTGVKRTFANGRPVAAGANKESVTVGNARTAATDSFGTSTAGSFGTAAAGSFGTATAGDNGYAVSRDYGLSVSGERGVSVVGLGGIAAAGVGGVLVFETCQPGGGGGLDVKSFGVDGETVKADTPYKLDYRKNLVEATDEVWQGGA